MVTKRIQTSRRTTAHDSPTTAEGLSALTAEELAELVDSREDEIAAAVADCTECDPEYND
jgi:hypothetical protein